MPVDDPREPTQPADVAPASSPEIGAPGTTRLLDSLADAVTAADLDRRVIAWNAAAERLYGIRAADALGRPLDDLFTSDVVGGRISAPGARVLALEAGSWRGRVIDRPLVGDAVGRQLDIETVLSRLDDADGRAIGVIAIKREVTDDARLARDLAGLASLALGGGKVRTSEAMAARALDVAIGSTGAAHGLIAVADGPSGRIIADRGSPPVGARLVTEIAWDTSPAIRAVAPVGRVLKGSVVGIPLTPTMRRALLDDGVQALLVVGLHRDEDLIGILTLGWPAERPAFPSDAAVLLIATQVAAGLENARLVEEIVRRVDFERTVEDTMRTIDELVRIGAQATTLDELLKRSSRLIHGALQASETAYGLLAADGESYAASDMVDVTPQLASLILAERSAHRSAFRRWRSGEGAFVEGLEPGALQGDLPGDLVRVAGEAGIRSHAAIPVRIDGALVGGIVVYFDRPVAQLRIDRGTLDRVAASASISLANYRLRERLIGSERRYRTLFAESPDALIVALPNGAAIDANDTALRMFRADRDWLVGRRPADLARLDGDRPIPDLEDLSDLVAVDPSGDGAAVIRAAAIRAVGIRRDGDRFPLDLSIAPMDLDGEPRLLLRARDLTDQERLQAELIQAQKMEATGQLVSGVAHELNNPLASILGFSQLIRRDPGLPEELRHNADLLVEEATRTRRIVQNLLDFARQRPPERHPTDIRMLIDSVLTLQSYSLGAGRIAVEVDVSADLPPVELDRSQLQQVLVNLIHNAVYAIRATDGSRIRISASAEGTEADRRVRITVTDDGAGVLPEHVGRLFEAFFTTKPAADGTGLGLPVSRDIVRTHGGDLRYGPASWGRGAAFTLDLPVRGMTVEERSAGPGPDPDTAPEDSAKAVEAGSSGDGPTGANAEALGRVLVVDDEAAIRIFLDRALRVLGYEPVIARDGEDAIAQVTSGQFVAILCDQRMPGLTGAQVHAAIVAARPELAPRMILMSGDLADPSIEALAAAWHLPLLAKPFDLETLQRAIRAAGG